jgi:hypothetical protein
VRVFDAAAGPKVRYRWRSARTACPRRGPSRAHVPPNALPAPEEVARLRGAAKTTMSPACHRRPAVPGNKDGWRGHGPGLSVVRLLAPPTAPLSPCGPGTGRRGHRGGLPSTDRGRFNDSRPDV